MKIINAKSTAATLILAASVLPAFGQFRGHGSDHGSNNGFERSGRPQFQQQRSFQPPAEQRNAQRGDSFRNRPVPQFQPQYQPRQFAPPRQTFRPQNIPQPAYRPDTRQFGGNAYRGDSGARYGFGGSGRYVIPQNRFYSSFGRNHFFRIGRPVFYGGYPRFQYGGFWFNFIGAPPAYWGPDWYYNDDVYIDYSDGGYYLYDNRYPGQGVPLNVDNGGAYDNGYSAPPDAGYSDPYNGSYGDGYGGSYPNPY
jgi:hypothetical protein